MHVGKRSRPSVRENRTDKKRLVTVSIKGKNLYTRLETWNGYKTQTENEGLDRVCES